MLNASYYPVKDGKLLKDLNLEQIKDFLARDDGLLWVDLEDTSEAG